MGVAKAQWHVYLSHKGSTMPADVLTVHDNLPITTVIYMVVFELHQTEHWLLG